jgi:hypothetical protein
MVMFEIMNAHALVAHRRIGLQVFPSSTVAILIKKMFIFISFLKPVFCIITILEAIIIKALYRVLDKTWKYMFTVA